ncbi:MAG: serine/threonine protein kinase [Kiritimatiellae bacterium]|nr:serine/threonine protein kinase [Kiritimatiellia bacterium]
MADGTNNNLTGDFRILEEFHGTSGGQGKVRRAIYEGDTLTKKGTEVALKLMSVLEEDIDQWERLEKRTRELSSIDHPNVVRYFGCFKARDQFLQDTHVVVQEFLHGETLKERLARNPLGLDADEALMIVSQVADGLAYTAERGIIHRDVKPGNIFICLDDAGRITGVKLIDFEIAKQQQHKVGVTGTTGTTSTIASGHMKGTYDYMAPDFMAPAFRGDERSDIFSLGVLLHEALTGRTPYRKSGGKGFEPLARWQERSQRLLSGGEGLKELDVSRRIGKVLIYADDVLRKMLDPDRTKRCPDFNGLRGLLAAIDLHRIHSDGDGIGDVKSYTLLRFIGKGGFGEVYKARQDKTGELVAVKRLVEERDGARFQKEAKVLKKLHDPDGRFVHFVDYFWSKADPFFGRNVYLVMGYLPGMPGNSLSDAIERANGNGLDVRMVLNAFIRYAQGLAVLHRDGIIHRDIKPSNLYFPNGHPEKSAIMDFGIVRDLSGTTTHGTLPGTLDYMPFELFDGNNNRGDAKSDIYALGLCLYRALTGMRAYPVLPKDWHSAIAEIIKRKIAEAKPDFEGTKNLPSKIVKPITKILVDMTDIRWPKRLGNAYIVAGLLQRVLGMLPSEPNPPSQPPVPPPPPPSPHDDSVDTVPSTDDPTTRPSMLKFFLRAAIVAVGLLLAVVGGMYLVKSSPKQDTKPPPGCISEIDKCITPDGGLDSGNYKSFAYYDFPAEFLNNQDVRNRLGDLGKVVEGAVNGCFLIEPIESRKSRLNEADAILRNKWTTNLLDRAVVKQLSATLWEQRKKLVFYLFNDTSSDIWVDKKKVPHGEKKLLEFADDQSPNVEVKREGFVPVGLTYKEYILEDGKIVNATSLSFKPETLTCTVHNRTSVQIKVHGHDVPPGQSMDLKFEGGLPDDWRAVADGYEDYALPPISDGGETTVRDLTPRMVKLTIPELASDVSCSVDGKPASGEMNIRPGSHKAVYTRGDYVDKGTNFNVLVGQDHVLDPPGEWTPTEALKALKAAKEILDKNILTGSDCTNAGEHLKVASGVVTEENKRLLGQLNTKLKGEIARMDMGRRIEIENLSLIRAEEAADAEQFDVVSQIIKDCDGLTQQNKERKKALEAKVEEAKAWIVGTIVNSVAFPVVVNGERIDQNTSKVFKFKDGKLPVKWVVMAVGYDDKPLSNDFNGKTISLTKADFVPREVVMSLPMLEKGVMCVYGGSNVVGSVRLRPGTGYSCVYKRAGYKSQTVSFDVKFNEDEMLPAPGEWEVALVEVSIPSFRDDVKCRIDGQERTSGEKIELKPGKHLLEYVRFGYLAQTVEFEVKPGGPEGLAPPAAWKASPVAMEVPHFPSGVKCKIDGQERASGEKIELKPGKHSLEYNRLGYKTQTSEVTVKLGTPETVPSPGEWKALPVEITVPHFQSGVKCKIDGQERASDEKIELKPGKYSLEYSCLGYETQMSEFSIEAGVPKRLSPPKEWLSLPVKITVPKLPEGVMCKIDEVEVASAGDMLLSAGRHSLEYSRFGCQTQSSSFTVKLGSPETVPPPGEWKALPVEITVLHFPSGVKCKIDGQERASGEKIELKPGKYSLEYRRLGYETQTSEITVKLGTPETVPPPGEWKALPVEITVPMLPDGVKCKIDGQESASGETVSLFHGSSHSCVYEQDGFETQTISFKVKYDNAIIPRPGEWKALPVEIVVPALPAGVTCKVDGQERSSGRKIELMPGEHSLEYVKADYEPMKSTIAVEPGKSQRLAPPGEWKPTPGLQALVTAEEAWNNRNWKGVEDSIAKANVVSEDAVLRKKAIQKALEKYNSIKGFIDAADTAKQYGDCKLYLESLGQAVKSGYMLTEADKRDAKEIYESKKGDLDATINRTKEMPAWKQHKANRDILRLEEEKREITRLYMEIKAE